MKKSLLVILFFFSLTAVSAQSFGVGGKVGLTLSTLDVRTQDQKYYFFQEGWHGDVYAYKMFNNFVGIESGLTFIQTGYVLDRKAIGDLLVDPVKVKTTYLSIPLSVRFRFGNFKNHPGGYFMFNPGIRAAFLLNDDQSNARQSAYNFTQDISAYDISLFASPGVQFPNGISVHSTFGYGLRNVIDEHDFKSKSFVLQFSVGYAFYSKK